MNSRDISIINTINYYSKHEDELKSRIYSIIDKNGYMNILHNDELFDTLNIDDDKLDEHQMKNLLYYDFKDLKYPCIHGIIYKYSNKNKIISLLISYSYFFKLLSTGLFILLFFAYIIFSKKICMLGASIFLISFIIIILIKKNYNLIIN